MTSSSSMSTLATNLGASPSLKLKRANMLF
jgi:hypothetical protein